MTRKSRSLDDVKLPPWRFIAFSDLHLATSTLDRAMQALAGVREYALQYGARVVFCGDFWESRGVLPVRLMHPLLDELHRWHDANIQAVFIPGNHDQVSTDGSIHGIRFFEPFPNITVATNRVLWPERKIAFIPWRDDPEEQAAMFDLKGKDWTIFAHAEVAGATTNHGHTAPGRVSLAQIKAHARACYVGHYHKRQKLGDRTWYIGSPFEQNFGEMGNATGCALITEEEVDPFFLSFPDFPRHHRVTYQVPYAVDIIGPHDIVEVYAEPDDLKTDDFRTFIRETIPATDVRPLPLKVEEDGAKEPMFALTLDQAIDAYVDEMDDGDGGDEHAAMLEQLKGIARAVLAELPEAKSILPLAPHVEIINVEIKDFCVLRGLVSLKLDKQGLMLLRGPMGVGKTAFVDAITWALYGQTSPRKAGTHGSTFRGDEVIHDDADSCSVEVTLMLRDGPEASEIVVQRTKKRGKGAKIRLEGIEIPEGISDTQELVDRLVGMPYGMWRTCVSLGQGAVGNFVTDADKARKEMLSQAFGLTACPPAQKLVRTRLKPLLMQRAKYELDIEADSRAVDALRESDFTEQIKLWEEQREATKTAAFNRGVEAQETIQSIDVHLKEESDWLGRRTQYNVALEELTKSLGAMTIGDNIAKLERDKGALTAEKSIVERDLALLKPEAQQLEVEFHKQKNVPCPTCGQPMPLAKAEKMVAEKHKQCDRYARAIRSFNTRLGNIQNDINNARRGDTSKREQIEASITESRGHLEKIGTALSTFARFRANRENAENQLAEAREVWERHEKETNPFEAKATELAGKLAKREAAITELRDNLDIVREQIDLLEFWDVGFGPKGLPVLVLRTALYELETYANRFMGELLRGRVWCQLVMSGDDLKILFYERDATGEVRERRYEQLSGGQRRCIELSFSPFALAEMVFNRCGVRIPLLVIDELTTHLGAAEKPLVCDILRKLDRDTILVIDHDASVQGEFDVVLEVSEVAGITQIRRAAA